MSQHVQRIFEPGLILHRVTSFILCLEGHPHAIISWGKSFLPACSSLMHSCIITFSHFNIGCRGEELWWRHCLGSLRDTSLALTISSWLLFCTLKRRCIGRSYSEQMPFHFFSPCYYARYWSTWDTQQSLSMSVDAFVERYSLSTNEPVWQLMMVQTRECQLDQSIQSSKRSQLTYCWHSATGPYNGLYWAYTRGSTLCSSGHTIASPCYSTHIRAISFSWAKDSYTHYRV